MSAGPWQTPLYSHEERYWVELALRVGMIPPTQPHRCIVESPLAKTRPEVTQSRDHNTGGGEVYFRARKVEHDHVMLAIPHSLYAELNRLLEVAKLRP